MQFCQPHWDALRQAIDDRGMSHLVAKNAEQAINDAMAQIDGTETLDNWDPLMAAHWAISNRVLKVTGLWLLSGPHCPLCEVDKSYQIHVDELEKNGTPIDPRALDSQGWIDSCSDGMLKFAREKNLMPGVQ